MEARGDEIAVGDSPMEVYGEVAKGLTHFLLAREGLAATDADGDRDDGEVEAEDVWIRVGRRSANSSESLSINSNTAESGGTLEPTMYRSHADMKFAQSAGLQQVPMEGRLNGTGRLAGAR